jgi:hypothetical protein
LRQKKIRLLLIKVLQQVSKKIKFAYFPFANKNFVFITKQGSKASLKLALLLFQQN